jgi:hypothetical protein
MIDRHGPLDRSSSNGRSVGSKPRLSIEKTVTSETPSSITAGGSLKSTAAAR